MSRIVVMPRSLRIWAPMPYSRESIGQAERRRWRRPCRALLLEVVRPDLVAEADARGPRGRAGTRARRGPPRRCGSMARVELHAAVAAQRTEHVAGEALGVHPHQHVALALHRAPDHRHVLLAVEERLVDVAGEVAPRAWGCGPRRRGGRASRSGAGTGSAARSRSSGGRAPRRTRRGRAPGPSSRRR